MPKITKPPKTATSRTPAKTTTTRSRKLSNPELETAGRAAEKTRRGGKPTTDETIRSSFTPGTVSPQTLERLNPTGTPVPAPLQDLYASRMPTNLAALDPERGFVPVRVPTRDELQGATTVTFGPSGAPTAGELHAGGKLLLSYDADRSPLKENLGSVPAWGVTAFIELQPSGARIEAPAVGFDNLQGRISAQPHAVPIAVDLPAGTTGVTVWFKQYQGADHPRTEWDSNYGQNYHFEVR